MEIKFKLVDEKHIDILYEGKTIGRIFTPSGSGEVEPNAIQVCGFEKAFDYWSCGVFGDGKGHPKKDIQLWFNADSQEDNRVIDRIQGDCCWRCFYPKVQCQCSDFKADFRHDDVVKEELIRGLK